MPTTKGESGCNTNDIAIYQWKANIHHLKSQLELSKAVIQAKDAAIDSLKLSNYQLQTLLISSKQLDDKQDNDNKDEKVLGGLASITVYKGNGFSINLAKILRRLKRRFT